MISRLEFALESGAVALPAEGRFAVFGAVPGYGLGGVAPERVHVIHGFRPEHDAWAAGFPTSVAPEGPYVAAIVALPRARAAAKARIAAAAEAVRPGGLVLVDGAKSDGIDAIFKAARKRFQVGEAVSKAHGKLFWFPAEPAPDWAAEGALITLADGSVTVPGIFSSDGPDPGSVLLAEALPAKLGPAVADLGAGWGYLARAILARKGVETLDLIEADHAAVEAARQNVSDPRAAFHWADATRLTEPVYNDVVTNPPFHAGRTADPEIGRRFIASAARALKPSGRLWLVANRHLPYERALADRFGQVAEIGGSPGFKLFLASKPGRGRLKNMPD